MAPPPKFKPFDPNSVKTFVPGGGFLASQYGGNRNQSQQDNHYGQQYGQYVNEQPYSGVQSPAVESLRSGASTPVLSTTASSTTSLSSLSAALKEVEQSPISEQMENIRSAKTLAEIRAAVGAIAEILDSNGAQSIETFNVHGNVVSLSRTKGSSFIREGSMMLLSTVARKFSSGPAEAYLLRSFTVPLDLLADKENSVKRAAQTCVDALYQIYPNSARCSALLSRLLEYVESSAKWQPKIGALKIIEKIINDVPTDFLEPRYVDSVPPLTNAMLDVKPELSKASARVLNDLGRKLDNQDIAPRIGIVIDTLSNPKKVQECIKTLSHVTFVAEVTEPALSFLVPILNRALNNTSLSQDSLRQTVIVTENLTRLVHDPREIKAFIPQLLPGVKKVVDTATQPEVRELAAKALKVLEDAEYQENNKTGRINDEEAASNMGKEVSETLKRYVSQLITVNVNTQEFKSLAEVYRTFLGQNEQEAEERAEEYKSLFNNNTIDDSSEEGIQIVNAEFSLAYGGRMLLSKTVLKLYKGRRYGLCGRNGAGKSTLMRSIAAGKLEGFPDKSELRTCFVEHNLQGSEADMDLVSFIGSDPELAHVDKDYIAVTLEEVGFDESRRNQNVGALSGGWKMKLELARAMLMKADILLLDEPTNHLDVQNVRWLQDYLTSHTEITSLIVTHDSGFLDAVCTDIIHYENKKLVYYKGNLSEFVKIRPEGKAYYTLTDSNLKMAFPPPGILTGVRSNTRAIARINNVTFTYPKATKPSLKNVSCSLSLSSRVAILGPNGAGKSTLIKLLTGELMPDEGRVEKHPNLRVGYIAQHALQHVELHKEKTPNQYLQWRYANGDDREVHLKQTRKMSEEEKAVMQKPLDVGDGKGGRVVEAIIGRQKLKKSFQYEIKWVGWLPRFNSFLTREFLIESGFSKLVQQFDDHEASREGLGYRELSPLVIRKHFEDVGLDGDIADHNTLGSLSGGQLVKVVIAGAMWNNPHLLVLDEPTNYLDRDSLGGLAVAIRDWPGSVVMISHNSEFVSALCPEQWIVQDGEVVQRGKTNVAAERFADSSGPSTTQSSAVNSDRDDDSPANIKVKARRKKLTRNELKARDVRRRLRYLEWLNSPKGTPKPPDTDDEED